MKSIIVVHHTNHFHPARLATFTRTPPEGWHCWEQGDDLYCCDGTPFSVIGDLIRRELHATTGTKEPWVATLERLFPLDQSHDLSYRKRLGEYCFRHADELGIRFATRTDPLEHFRPMTEADLHISGD